VSVWAVTPSRSDRSLPDILVRIPGLAVNPDCLMREDRMLVRDQYAPWVIRGREEIDERPGKPARCRSRDPLALLNELAERMVDDNLASVVRSPARHQAEGEDQTEQVEAADKGQQQ
jgi:hypothetical protein